MSAGVYAAGAGIIFGLIIPFFHSKPDNEGRRRNSLLLYDVNEAFPINFEFVSFDDKGIDVFRIGYTVRF